MLGERIASQSVVIRTIVSGYSPCCGPPHHRVRIGRRPAHCRGGLGGGGGGELGGQDLVLVALHNTQPCAQVASALRNWKGVGRRPGVSFVSARKGSEECKEGQQQHSTERR